MVDKKLVLTSGASILITLILVLGGVSLSSPKVYYCEERNLAMECDSLASYYSLPNGKCVNAKIGNKLCKTGWTNDFSIIDEITIEEDKKTECSPYVVAYTDNGKYFCDKIGKDAKCILDNTLSLPIE